VSLGILRTKSLDDILQDAEEPGHSLKRALGAGDLILLGIGAIIGAGIFATIGTAAAGDAARPGAGPALMISFVITAVVCSFTALCYAELASMVPISGSAYTYSYATLGEVVAWIIGWDLIIEYAVGNIGVAISWANYFKTFIEGFKNSANESYVTIPAWMATDYRTAAKIIEDNGLTVLDNAPHIAGYPIVFNFLAAAIIAVLTVLLVWGVKESARFNAIMVGVKIVVLTFFCVTGFFYIQADNYTPFAPQGLAGISSAAAIVFFAYIGFDAVSTVAEETRDPQRNLPRGIIGSLIICTVFYVIVAVIFTGLISYTDLSHKLATEQAEPLTMALEHVQSTGLASKGFIDLAILIVAFGSVIAHTAVLLVFQLGQPRIFFAMARDGLLPQTFAKVHPRFQTPHITTILTGVLVGGFAGLASLDEMVDLTNIGTLFAFILVCVGVIVLRKKDPDRPRPFRVPGGPVVPVLGIVSCAYLIYFLPPTSWLRFAAWLCFGFIIYVAYGTNHSRLTGRNLEGVDKPGHDAESAWIGTLLGLIGTGMMAVAYSFDMYLLTGKIASGGAEAPTWWPQWWWHPSWFLIVPLALNILILYPLLISRSRKALAGGVSGVHATRARLALVLSLLLMIASVVYLALCWAHGGIV
jgi:APA family basic amino acid/polyamine antiporter